MKDKMQYVKNFNQILLAIAGVIGIIFLLAVVTFAIIDFWPQKHVEAGMITTEEAENLTAEGLRKEIITFEEFRVLDSADQIYLLPVGYANLDEPESDSKSLGLYNNYNYHGDIYYGGLSYNNFVVHYGKEASSHIVFNDRLGVREYVVSKLGSRHLLLAVGCDEDTNKDEMLNSNDLLKLFAFDIDAKELKGIETPKNSTVLDITLPSKSDLILCKLGIDRNSNGIYDHSVEPTTFMKLNTETLVLEPLVHEDNLIRTQEILEGK